MAVLTRCPEEEEEEEKVPLIDLRAPPQVKMMGHRQQKLCIGQIQMH